MKRIIFILSLIAFTAEFSLSADFPTDKGSMMFSGNFVFSSIGGKLYQANEERISSIQTNPTFGYFIYPGLNIGIKAIFNRISQGEYSDTIWGIGPTVSYFFRGNKKPTTAIKNITFPYPYLTISNFCSNFDLSESNTTLNGLTINLGMGLLTMVDDYVGINMEVSYDFDKIKYNSKTEDGNRFNILIGITVFKY